MKATTLLRLCSVALAITGIAYVAVPASALAIVSITSTPTTDFLLRTEGVLFLFAAATVWTLASRDARGVRTGLLAVAGYLLVSSLVDLVAFAQQIVGSLSIPSAIVRIAVGLACIAIAWRGRPG